MNYFKPVLVCLMCLLSTSVHADAVDDLHQLLEQSATLQAGFEQRVTDESGALLQESHGDIALRRPNQFRWESQTPFQYLLVSDGVTLWRYDADLEQLDSEPLAAQLADSPARIFSASAEELATDYLIEKRTKGDDSDTTVFELRPREGQLFVALQLHFVAGELRAMSLQDSLEQHTRIRFITPRYNLALPDSLFQFDGEADQP